MLNDILLNPSKRVFHIDKECYVIFTGTKGSDKTAFIRMGNSHALIPELHDYISGLIVTNHALGDPYLEKQQILSTDKKSLPIFMGVPQIIKRYKQFFELSKILSTKYEIITKKSEAQTKTNHIYLYYIDIDAIEVMLEKTSIFSLRKREIEDLHYLQGVQKLVTLYERYAKPYGNTALQNNGFFTIKNTPYLYVDGKVVAINPPIDYYSGLMLHGYDPRYIDVALFLKPNLVFHRFVVDVTNKIKNQTAFFAQSDASPDAQSDTIAAAIKFAESPIRFKLFDSKQQFVIDSMTINTDFTVTKIVIDAESNTTLTIDQREKVWRVSDSYNESSAPLIAGLPYKWNIKTMYRSQNLIKTFLPTTFNSRTHGISTTESALLNMVMRFLSIRITAFQKLTFKNIKKTVRRLPNRIQRYTALALGNLTVLLEIIIGEHAENKHGAYYLNCKKVFTFLDALSNKLSLRIDPDNFLYPHAFIELRLTVAGIRQLVHYDWNRDAASARHEQAISKSIQDIINIDDKMGYTYEMNRLLQFIMELESDEEKVAALKKLKLHKILEEKLVDSDELFDEEPESLSDDDIGQDSHKKKKRSSYKKRKRRRRILIIGIVAAGVIVAGAIIWYFSYKNYQEQQEALRAAAEQAEVQEATELGGTTADEFSALNIVISDLNVAATVLSDDYFTIDSVFGSVTITLGEILSLSNIIAELNGYRRIGVEDALLGDNPDIIFPFEELQLPPNSERYQIAVDDSIWRVAIVLMQNQITDHLNRLAKIQNTIATEDVDTQMKADFTTTITQIIVESYCDSLKMLAQTILDNL